MGTIEDKVMVESRWAGSRSGRLLRRCSGPTPEGERREVVIEEEERHKKQQSVSCLAVSNDCSSSSRPLSSSQTFELGLSSIYST